MRSLLLVSALVLSACPERPPPEEEVDSGISGDPLWADGSMELGTQLSDLVPTFEPMPASMELHPGAQGGFHVPVMYRITGHTQAGATFEHRVRRSRDGVLVSRGTRFFDIAADGGSWTSEEPITIFMCPTPVGVNVAGEELTFEITVIRGNGVLLTRTTAKTRLLCPASNQAFCESICKG